MESITEVTNVYEIFRVRKRRRRLVLVEMKGCSPRDRDVAYHRRKKRIWLPKKVREHPKTQQIFGSKQKREVKAKAPILKPRKPSKPNRLFNKAVEQAYITGKL